MAVPKIYTISPSSGLASGRERVVIGGLWFALPTAPSPLEVAGELVPSVSLTFGGVAADLVAVLSDKRIVAVTPPFRGDPASMPTKVDVVVQNLDSNGDAVPGESYTATNGYEFRRPDISTGNMTALRWISRQVLRDIRRNVIDNVAISSSPDWSSDPSTGMAAIAELPAVLIEGPTISENTFYRYSDVRDENFSDGVGRNAAPFTADLEWNIILLARRKWEALNICDTALRFFRRRPMFSFPLGPSDSTIVECRRYFGDWRATDKFDSQVFAYESTLKLEALVFDDDEGMPVDEGIVYEIDNDPELNFNPVEVDDV